jgi:hypothetical protein
MRNTIIAAQDAFSIFDVASKVSTPLAVAGFLAAAFFLILRQILTKTNLFPTLKGSHAHAIIVLIIERLFALPLVAIVLGFAGYVLQLYRPSGRTANTESAVPVPSPEDVKIVRNIATSGGLYSGPWKDGKPFGKGSVVGYHCGDSWIYQGDMYSGDFEGSGEMKIWTGAEWYKGVFRRGKFVSGECLVYAGEDSTPFYVSYKGGLIGLAGRYRGQCVVASNSPYLQEGLLHPDGGDDKFRPDLLTAEGNGVFYLREKDPRKGGLIGEFTVEGEWKSGEFRGNGRVTKVTTGSYLEGEFRNSLLIKGKAYKVSGVFFGLAQWPNAYMRTYTGAISNGVPDGEGELEQGFAFTDDEIYPIKFSGTFRDGKWWNGTGYLPQKYGDFFEGKLGEWRNGEFYNG